MSLGLGLSVLAAVGQIDGNLRGAIARDLPKVAPSYFFVDIQKDQISDFVARVSINPQVTRMDTAPMLRGIITQINGVDANEVAGDHWVIRGDRGLTFAATLPERTTLTAGTWWEADYSGPPLLSFAAEEAAEIGLELGIGASRRQILLSFALRSALLGAAAGIVALAVGILGGWAVNHFVMEAKFAVVWPSALAIIFGGLLANLLAGLGFALKSLASRPAQTLRSRD